ncbi:MAG: transferrin receptor-like dimerization domain-containing protein, partial [Gemmatimonadaceae bacterium]
PAVLGSAEWAETHAKELTEHAVAYLNSDNSQGGYLGVSGSHILEKFINGVARDITDPETGASVERRMRAADVLRAPPARRNDIRTREDLPIGALGSGSDYTTFVQHLGIPSLDMGYYGEARNYTYHSAYDDFYWFTHYSDTSFVYERALAQTIGSAAMRLADADVIPYDFTDLAETVSGYTGELKRLATGMAFDVAEHNREVEDSTFMLTNNPRAPLATATLEAPVPRLDFTALDSADARLTRAAAAYQSAFGSAMRVAASGAGFGALNSQLIQSEHMLTSDAGLPGRPWFKHLLYAPGVNTGYGVKTMPGVREAIEASNWPLATSEMARVATALDAETALVQRATADLKAQ